MLRDIRVTSWVNEPRLALEPCAIRSNRLVRINIGDSVKCEGDGDDDIKMDVWGGEHCQMTCDAQTRDPSFEERGELDSPVSQTLPASQSGSGRSQDDPVRLSIYTSYRYSSWSTMDTEDGMESDEIQIVAGGSGQSTGLGSGAAAAGPGDDDKSERHDPWTMSIPRSLSPGCPADQQGYEVFRLTVVD
ncbi:hypothetical protein CLIM01_10813 [Colletotrichum limetticola]|uniref:Uncharacterized protein n=1 Tax=Colletotrichum limetticola TaxID=1209924 RepID=A0ABQ9PIT0_9PEZI|nr:hypothetical protein CLIM01_10813 [Colletotrichum limetticola]